MGACKCKDIQEDTSETFLRQVNRLLKVSRRILENDSTGSVCDLWMMNELKDALNAVEPMMRSMRNGG